MALQQFLSITAGLPTLVVRRAMVGALAVEPARTAQAYRRFYCRVLAELVGGTPRALLLRDSRTLAGLCTFVRHLGPRQPFQGGL